MPALSFAVKYQRMQIPSRWHIEHHHRERQLPIFIIAVVEHEPEARFVFVTGALPFEVRMLSYHIGNVRKYRRQVFVTVENDDGGFGVSPRRIAEQLVNLCFEVYWVIPDQALPDENVPPTDLDDDVGLAFPVEGFSRGPPVIMDAQRHQQHEAQGFFIHFGKRFRIKFHDPRHAANRLQDVVEDSFNKQRVSRMWSPRCRGACHAQGLSLNRNSIKLRGVHLGQRHGPLFVEGEAFHDLVGSQMVKLLFCPCAHGPINKFGIMDAAKTLGQSRPVGVGGARNVYKLRLFSFQFSLRSLRRFQPRFSCARFAPGVEQWFRDQFDVYERYGWSWAY